MERGYGLRNLPCPLPFVVAMNCFDDAPRYDPEGVRVALDLDRRIPVMACDARQHASVKEVLIIPVEHLLARIAPAVPEQAAGPVADGLTMLAPSAGEERAG